MSKFEEKEGLSRRASLKRNSLGRRVSLREKRYELTFKGRRYELTSFMEAQSGQMSKYKGET